MTIDAKKTLLAGAFALGMLSFTSPAMSGEPKLVWETPEKSMKILITYLLPFSLE